MAHTHLVIDTDVHYKIDGITRTIVNVNETKRMLVQNDHNSERLTFEVPRYVDGHDLTECNIVQVHYANADTYEEKLSSGVYEVDDLHVKGESGDDANIVILSWLVSGNATKYVGTLNFIIRFSCVVDGFVEYAWNTTIFKGITILEGIYNSDVIVEQYPDVLASWGQRISELEDSSLLLDTTLSVAGAAADAAVTGNTIRVIEKDIADLKYVEIDVTSVSNNVGNVEQGRIIDEVTVNWTLNKEPVSQSVIVQDITTNVEVSERSTTLKNLQLVGDTSMTVKVVDERNKIATKTTNIKFLNGVYYGVLEAGTEIDSAVILGLSKKLQTGKAINFTVAPNNARPVYALPTRYGVPVFRIGGFEYEWKNVASFEFVNAYGYTENYDVWMHGQNVTGSITINVT